MANRTLNVILKYRVKGESDFRFQGASCIRLDGTGTLALTHPETGSVEKLSLESIDVFAIHSMAGSSRQPLAA